MYRATDFRIRCIKFVRKKAFKLQEISLPALFYYYKKCRVSTLNSDNGKMKNIAVILVALFVTASTINAQTKHVLLEELTGTWCNYCPGGTYYLDSLSKEYSNFIGVAIHVSDVMENTTYATTCGLGGAPTANIDRGGQGLNVNYWFPSVASAFNNTPAADINVTTNFNAGTRLLTAEVSASFASPVSGNYRLAAIITEDGVTGPSPQYDQGNFIYSGGGSGPMGGFGYLPQTVPAYMIAYNHVGRELLGGYNGQAGSVPASVSAGDVVSYVFTYTIPATWNENNIRVVGLLLKPDNTVDNAGRSLYLDGNSNAKPLFLSTPSTNAFVGSPYVFDAYSTDPDDEILTITALDLPSWITMSPQSQLGMIHTKATLSGTPTTTGTYPVKIMVSDGTRSDTLDYTITVNAVAGTWELEGVQGFTDIDNNLGIVADKNGVLYALIANNGICNVFQKPVGGNWNNLGNLNGNGDAGHIRLGFDSLTPYVAYCNPPSLVTVKKYNSGTWSQIGNFPTNGVVNFGFDLDANDNPYIACQDVNNGSKGSCYAFNGAAWSQLGSAPYSGTNVSTCNDLVLNTSNGNVYVLWSNYSNGQVPVVSEWNGTSWSMLGGASLSSDPVNYHQNIVIDQNTQQLYTAHARYSGGSKFLDVYEFNGTSWVNIGSNVSNGVVDEPKMTIDDNGDLLVTFIDFNYSSSVSAMRYSNGNWNYIGPSGFSNALSSDIAITAYQNTPYVLYKDGAAANKATVRFYSSAVSGVDEINNTTEAIILYPNPATEHITISDRTDYHGEMTISIYSVFGSLVKRETLYQDQQSIHIGDLSNGNYLVTITTDDFTQNQQLLIQR